MRYCLLMQNKICDGCMECDNRCDLDPTKVCDNCCLCIEQDAEYLSIPISDIVVENTAEYINEYFSQDIEWEEREDE